MNIFKMFNDWASANPDGGHLDDSIDVPGSAELGRRIDLRFLRKCRLIVSFAAAGYLLFLTCSSWRSPILFRIRTRDIRTFL